MAGASDNMISMLSFRHAILLLLVSLVALTGCRGDGDVVEDESITAVELYENAKKAMNNGSYERAIRQYRLLQSRFPFGRYAEQSQLELAYSYFKNFDPELADATLDRFLRTYPTHQNADYAYYLKGLIGFSRNRGVLTRLLGISTSNRDLEFARDAFRSFGELIQRYPDSRYAEDARDRMLYLRDEMAAYEVEVARYYMRRKAYIAAANRAKYVVENYQEAPQSGDALAIMTEAYELLEFPELSEDAYRVLRLNYPEHPYITGRYEKESLLRRLWPFD